MVKNLRYIVAMLMVVIFMITAGCDQKEKAEVESSSKSVETEQGSAKKENKVEKKIKVYFANEDATGLVAREKESKEITDDKYTVAIKMLIEGTTEKGTVSMIPPKTKVRGIKIENGIAYVNFSQELIKKFNGGSAGEIMLVGSIVNTLTEFPEIKAVQIMVEGEKVETIAGHMDTSEPLKRFEHLVGK